MNIQKLLVVLVAGALFGFGLSLSTMIRPEVVLSFLRFQDWGLMLVMGGAVVVTLVAYTLAPRLMTRPLLGGSFGQHHALRVEMIRGKYKTIGVGKLVGYSLVVFVMTQKDYSASRYLLAY